MTPLLIGPDREDRGVNGYHEHLLRLLCLLVKSLNRESPIGDLILAWQAAVDTWKVTDGRGVVGLTGSCSRDVMFLEMEAGRGMQDFYSYQELQKKGLFIN